MNIFKGESRTKDFAKLNPALKIPVITEGDFKLAEGHTILRYLHSSRKCPDHWYPKDAKKRALVDQYLDWHHTNLRAGSYQQFRKRFIFPIFGIEPVER